MLPFKSVIIYKQICYHKSSPKCRVYFGIIFYVGRGGIKGIIGLLSQGHTTDPRIFLVLIPYQTKISGTKLAKIWLGAETFVRRKFCP